MTIGEMHDILIEELNQGQGGYFPPEVRDHALNLGSFDKFNEEKRAFEANQYISDNLAKFKTKATLTFTAGSSPRPTDYGFATNASTTGDKQIEIVPESEWVERINDPIAVPDTTHPILAIRSAIQIVPSSITSSYLYYLKRPATMVFTYSDDDGDVTQTGGTDCDWPAECHGDIVLRALVYLGAPLSDEQALRLKAYKKQTEAV